MLPLIILYTMKSLISAVRTLTIIPIPGKDTENFASAIPLFPIPAIVLGCIPFSIYHLFLYLDIDNWRIASLLALFLSTYLTGFLHVDGLGDVADAFGGGKTKERILEILKDSRMGTYGISAIVFDLLFKLYLWEWAFENQRPFAIVFSLVLGRVSQMLFLIFMKSARTDGIAASFIKSNRISRFFTLISAGLVFALFGLVFSKFILFISIIVFLVVIVLSALFFNIKISGITGDCLGTVNEIMEISILISILGLSVFS